MIKSKTCEQQFIDFYIDCLKLDISNNLWLTIDAWMLSNFNLNFEEVLRADVATLKRIVNTTLVVPVNVNIESLKNTYDKFGDKARGVGSGNQKAKAFGLVRSISKKLTCPYCNLTPIENNEISEERCSELDHFYHKADFPQISLSIFNLVPVCGICNRKKGTKRFEAHPYDPNDVSNLSKFFVRKVNGEFVVDYHIVGDMTFNDNHLKNLGRYCNFDDEVKWILKTTRENNLNKVHEMLTRRPVDYPDIYTFIDKHFKIKSKREEHYIMAQSKFTSDIIRSYYGF